MSSMFEQAQTGLHPSLSDIQETDLGPESFPPEVQGEIQHVAGEVSPWHGIQQVLNNCATLLVVIIYWQSLDLRLLFCL